MRLFGDDPFPLPRQRPLSLPTAPQLALLYALTNLPRLLLLTYIPMVAITALKDVGAVSVLYLTSSLGAVVASVGLPKLLRYVRRRSAYTVIAAGNVAAFTCFSFHHPIFLYAGLLLFVAGSAANEILLNLYALENLSRAGQSRYEPLRVTFSIFGFICAPSVGAIAGTWVSPQLPFFIAMGCVVAGLIYLYMTTIKPRPATERDLPNPFTYLRRYLKQPRLRLAYVLALGRAAWWQMFFVYSPIVLLELGYSAKLAGMMGSIALSMTILIPLWTRLAKAIGVRRMLMFGYTISGLSMISIAVFHNSPTAVFALLILAAFCTTSIDGVGNIFFLRAVHPYERVEMSAVFATYRDISQSAPPLIVAPLLKILELPIILGALGGVMLGLAHLSHHLPRRL